MKAFSLLSVVLPVAFTVSTIGCAATPTAPDRDSDPSDESDTADKKDDASPVPAARAPAAQAPALPSSKIQDGITSFAVSKDGATLFVTTGATTLKLAPDGTAPVEIPELKTATVVAIDGSRVYGLLPKKKTSFLFFTSKFFDLTSASITGGNAQHHADLSEDNPKTMTVSLGRVYVSTEDSGHIFSTAAALPTDGKKGSFQKELDVDTGSVAPVFVGDKLFAASDRAVTRFSLADRSKVVVFSGEIPSRAGGIAVDGTNVYTRTAAGIVSVPVGAAANTTPAVVVPAATCTVADPADEAGSALEDTLAVDTGTIYTACRNGANVEIRAYAVSGGTLTKTVATQPYTGNLSRLQVTAQAVYWQQNKDTTGTAQELWRAGR